MDRPRHFMDRLSRLLVVLPGTALLLGTLASGHALAAATPTYVAQARSLVSYALDNYEGHNDRPPGVRFYSDGLWHASDNTQQWSSTQGGAALAAATLWSYTGRTDAHLLHQAVDTIERAIATRQLPNGSFAPPAGIGDDQPKAIATQFFGRHMATAYLLVRSRLSATQQRQWERSIARAANFLIDHHEIDWYVNGNVNLGYAGFLYLAWRATGDMRFAQAYNAEWEFVLHPGRTQPRFASYGLRLTRAPKRSDWSDGAGYLVEAGDGGLGFDPEYGMAQLGTALDLWITSGDPRTLRLANVLYNGLRSRIGNDFELSTRGTRHVEAGRHVPFVSVAIPVLSTRGGRTDLGRQVSGFMAALRTTYVTSLSWPTNPVLYGKLGEDVSAVLRAYDPHLAALRAPSTSAVFPAATTARATQRGTARRATTKPRLTQRTAAAKAR